MAGISCRRAKQRSCTTFEFKRTLPWLRFLKEELLPTAPILTIVGMVIFWAACSQQQEKLSGNESEAAASAGIVQPQPPPGEGWRPLFNGRDLSGWEITRFGGEGDVEVTSGRLVLEMGSDLTGITWIGDLTTDPFEIILEAERVRGNDFFCGLTFPVGKEFCTLIAGGWGGALVGLSSIDSKDASENDTRTYLNFENGRWYAIRLQVSSEAITVWIDEEMIIDAERAGHEFSVRPEVRLSRPLGIATWRTTAAIRSIWYRKLSEP